MMSSDRDQICELAMQHCTSKSEPEVIRQQPGLCMKVANKEGAEGEAHVWHQDRGQAWTHEGRCMRSWLTYADDRCLLSEAELNCVRQ